MKKIFIPFIVLTASLFVSCGKQDIQPEEQHLRLNLTINNEASTRARKADWEAGDVVNVFFRIEDTSPIPYLKLTYDGTDWEPTWTAGHEAEIAGTTGGKLIAVYSPVSCYVESMKWWGVFSGYAQLSHINGGIYCLVAEKVDYTVSDGALTATMNMVSLYDTWVNFVIKDIDPATVDNWTFACNHVLKASFCGVKNSFAKLTSAGGYGDAVPGFAYKGEVMFGGPVNAIGKASDYTFTVVNNNGTPSDTSDDVAYQATFTGRTLHAMDQIVLPDISTWPTL